MARANLGLCGYLYLISVGFKLASELLIQPHVVLTGNTVKRNTINIKVPVTMFSRENRK